MINWHLWTFSGIVHCMNTVLWLFVNVLWNCKHFFEYVWMYKIVNTSWTCQHLTLEKVILLTCLQCEPYLVLAMPVNAFFTLLMFLEATHVAIADVIIFKTCIQWHVNTFVEFLMHYRTIYRNIPVYKIMLTWAITAAGHFILKTRSQIGDPGNGSI